MARIDGKYIYETSEYRYLPNLHILKMNKKSQKPTKQLHTKIFTKTHTWHT